MVLVYSPNRNFISYKKKHMFLWREKNYCFFRRNRWVVFLSKKEKEKEQSYISWMETKNEKKNWTNLPNKTFTVYTKEIYLCLCGIFFFCAKIGIGRQKLFFTVLLYRCYCFFLLVSSSSFFFKQLYLPKNSKEIPERLEFQHLNVSHPTLFS